MAARTGLSKSTIGRIWKKFDLKPHLQDSFKLPTDPFFCYIETAYSHNIISGYSDGTFRPGNSATRGQICKIVYQAIAGP